MAARGARGGGLRARGAGTGWAAGAAGAAGTAGAGGGGRGAGKGWVEVAAVVGAHGVAGEVKARPWTDWAEERLGTPGQKWLRPPAPLGGRGAVPPEAEEYTLARGRPTLAKGKEQWLLKFKGVNDRCAAEALRGWTVVVEAADRPPLAPSPGEGGGEEEGEEAYEYYASDLVGLAVRDGPSGAFVGEVSEVLGGTGTHDTLEVVVAPDFPPDEAPAPEALGRAPRRTLLVPFAREIVPSVNLEDRELVLNPPGGLYALIVQPKIGKKKNKKRAAVARRGGKRSSKGEERSGSADGEVSGQ